MNILTFVLLGFIGVIIITSLIGFFIGLIIETLKFILYKTIHAVFWVLKKVGKLFAFLFKKIYNKIHDHFYPDEGAYYIRFTPKNRKGTSRIKYFSIR